MSRYDIRALKTAEEFRSCVALQEETWGHGFSERVPTTILRVAQTLGGVASGAFDERGALVGFVFGMTGVRNGEVVHWSDMLAVRRNVRDSGVGAELKAYQRRVLLEANVTKMFWSFDPLQSRNAYLNFSKLGIVVREYVRDMYGQTDSPLHRGIGTDRFVALWLMDSDRVQARIEGRERGSATDPHLQDPSALAEADRGLDLPFPGEPVLGLDAHAVRVAIPGDVSHLMATSMDLAVAWRKATRATLTHYLDRGYEVCELLRGVRTSDYLLTREQAP